jgi:hypothetical protein
MEDLTRDVSYVWYTSFISRRKIKDLEHLKGILSLIFPNIKMEERGDNSIKITFPSSMFYDDLILLLDAWIDSVIVY